MIKSHLSFVCLGFVLFCAGCLAPEPLIVLQTVAVDCPSPTAPSTCAPTASPTATLVAKQPLETPAPASQLPAVSIYFAPDRNAEEGAAPRLYAEMGELLEDYAGMEVRVVIPTSERDTIDALCAGDADVAWMSAPAYLLAEERCRASARYRGVRFGWAATRGQIMVQSARVRTARGLAPIESLAALKGGSMGYTEPESTTGHLFAKAALARAGVELAEEIFLAGDAQAVLAVYSGEVDAAAGFWAPPRADGTIGDARVTIVDAYPDVAERVEILSLSDVIPSDPLVFRDTLSEEVAQRLCLAFDALARSEEGRLLLFQLYGLTGLLPTHDGDYDGVREIGSLLNVDWGALLIES
jgi:phosphonate transport system substrate-binding protein